MKIDFFNLKPMNVDACRFIYRKPYLVLCQFWYRIEYGRGIHAFQKENTIATQTHLTRKFQRFIFEGMQTSVV